MNLVSTQDKHIGGWGRGSQIQKIPQGCNDTVAGALYVRILIGLKKGSLADVVRGILNRTNLLDNTHL